MVKVIGVRFRRAGKIYYFAPGKHKVNRGDAVIVETVRGVEYGHVVLGPKEIPDDEVIQPLKYVIRKATGSTDRGAQPGKRKRSIQDLPGKDQKTWSGNEADRCGIYL